MSVIEKIPGEWQCSNAEYHASDLIGHSMLEDFRRSRRYFHAVYVAKTLAKPEPTPAMRLGTLFHLAVLEPERFSYEVVREPKFDRRTKEGKAAFADFAERHAGKLMASPDEYETVCRMVEAVNANKVASEWLSVKGKSEHSIVWQDEKTGVECKSRRDRVIPGWIIDLKKAQDASPRGFARSAATFGYDRQNAWYVAGHEAVTGKAPGFVFIVASDVPPHEVAVYQLNPDDVADAAVRNATTLKQLAECAELDDWLGLHEKQVNKLSLPNWTKYIDEYEVNNERSS